MAPTDTLPRSIKAAIIAPLLMLASCGPADGDPGPGGVTAGDAKALDRAAQKLDERDQSVAKDEK